MPLTAIEGIVENGKIRLREDIRLEENTKVYVIVMESPSRPVVHIYSPKLADPSRAGEFRKQVIEFDSDA
jgi:hypothetical protein